MNLREHLRVFSFLIRVRKGENMQNYTTQMDAARKGIVTPQMKIVAEKEHMT